MFYEFGYQLPYVAMAIFHSFSLFLFVMAIFHVDIPNHPKVTTRRVLKGGVPVGNPRTTWRCFEYIWENHRNLWENIKQAPNKNGVFSGNCVGKSSK